MATKEYNQQYNTQHRKKISASARYARRQKKLKAIKYLGGHCVDCDFDDLSRPEAFDFDHVDNKVVGIGKILKCSWATILKELLKCELVCSNCHRTRTEGRRDGEK